MVLHNNCFEYNGNLYWFESHVQNTTENLYMESICGTRAARHFYEYIFQIRRRQRIDLLLLFDNISQFHRPHGQQARILDEL